MPSGPKPGPPGSATDRNARAHAWNHAPGKGWQHGRKPKAPEGLSAEAQAAWRDWLSSWWAAFWAPEDLPQLRLAIRAFDLALTDPGTLPKALPLLTHLGLTPKGRQDLRWLPAEDATPATAPATPAEAAAADEVAAARARRTAQIQ